MNEHGRRLRKLVSELVGLERCGRESHSLVLDLALLLRKMAEGDEQFVIRKRNQEVTGLEGGVALGAWAASSCAEDQVRTARFIRGAVLAVKNRLVQRPGQPIHLLEAGCGPLATLAAPLAAYFDANQLQLTLVDIHEESVHCAGRVMDGLGLSDRVRELRSCDVSELLLEDEVDVILTETMWAGLFREPQVAITRHLVRQHPGATLVPREIRIELALLNASLEMSAFPPEPKDRRLLGPVFVLNRESACAEERDGFLEAVRLKVPSPDEAGRELFLTTTVEVAEGEVFADYESQVTIPLPMREEVRPGESWSFRYRLGAQPGPEWRREV